MKTLILTVLMTSTSCLYSQIFVQFKIFAITSDKGNIPPEQVKKNSDSKISLSLGYKESKATEFIQHLNSNDKTEIEASTISSFRYKCTVYYNIFSVRTIYFSENGDYYYRGEYYQKDKLFEYVYKCVNDTEFGVL